MEVPVAQKHGTVKPSPPPSPPKRCRCRCLVLESHDRFVEVTIEAEVLHIFDGFLDVAVLRALTPPRTKPYVFAPLPWRSGRPSEGVEVWAVGHGLFGPGTPFRGPAITSGHITKVAPAGNTRRAAIIRSTAAVHRGCSGGALVEAASGAFMGLVTTNVKQQDGAVMPHVNFSLPVDLLDPLREFLAKSTAPGDFVTLQKGERLEDLVDSWRECSADEQEQALWRLEPEPLDLPSRVEERRQHALQRMDQLAEDAAAAEKAVGDQQAQADRAADKQSSAEAAAPAATVQKHSVTQPPRSAL